MKHLKPRGSWILATVLALIWGCNSSDLRSGDIVAAAPTTAPATNPSALVELDRRQIREVEQMRKAVYYLASDDLEGRGLQTEGLDKAADFISKSFKSSGLKALPGMNGYFQPFKATIGTRIHDDTRLMIGGNELALGKDFTPILPAEGSFDAPVVFAGYAIASEELKYNDFDRVDVKGKVVLALRYQPMDENRKNKLGDADLAQSALVAKAKAAADRGAVALLIVNPPSDTEPDELATFGRTRGLRASIPVVQLTRAAAALLLPSGDAQLLTLQNQIDSTLQPQSLDLGTTIAGDVRLEIKHRNTKNVVAYIPGKGPNKDEYVVVGAHYDHVGLGESGAVPTVGPDKIYNGADDNASGTVAIMHLAKRLAKQKPPARSIIFVAFSGEERGLLGSAHFVNNPPVPLDSIVAMMNLDMVGRLKGAELEIGGTGTSSEFDRIVAAADQRSIVKLKPAGGSVGGRGGIGPSDHASFAAKKIPVMFIWTGNHSDYHRPTDHADKINYDGMLYVLDATEHLVNELTSMPRTQYVDTFDRSMSRGALRVRLGIMPDYSDGDDGVRVSSVTSEGPAGKAGIVADDVIVQIGTMEVANMDDYMKALSENKPGDTVSVAVMRKGERKEFEATFPARRGRGN